MFGEGGHGSGADVRGGTDLHGDVLGGQVSQQCRVGDRAGAVPDPLGAQIGQRRPDELRAAGLAGVRHQVQPAVAGQVERVAVALPRHADLVAAESETDGAFRSVLQHPLGGRHAVPVAERARDVEDPGEFDAVSLADQRTAGCECRCQFVGRDAE
jgi:hypothetical protein